MDVKEFVSLGLALLAVGVILFAYMRRRRRAKAESEKRIDQARRRQFIEVAQERRSGLPRRKRALGLLNAALAHPSHHSASKISSVPAKSWSKAAADNMHGGVATQRDVSAIRDYPGVERRKSSRRTIAHRRGAAGWRPNAVNRRQTPGRRREDRL